MLGKRGLREKQRPWDRPRGTINHFCFRLFPHPVIMPRRAPRPSNFPALRSLASIKPSAARPALPAMSLLLCTLCCHFAVFTSFALLAIPPNLSVLATADPAPAL